ncbi:hypothetical protein V1Y59_02705 [Gordonia sp. PKS22-38]|uniref:PQQ-like domain-containing protein n=1 Tax=Gordonia prachuapensis TaxID=3115651 RepID=A0ABU7MPU1_9ACTN|nr:hypothetical protein [Gordonia sp. PKS22-38]
MAMPARSPMSDLARRLPFGIGTVTMVLVAAMIATVGVVLAIGTPENQQQEYVAGQLRGYEREPDDAWTHSDETLPDYQTGGGIEVADTHADQWLLSYPSGLGRAYQLVDKRSGATIWGEPVVAGLGDCAFDEFGQVGCAVKVGGISDGFYLVDDDGPGSPTPLDDTKQVIGLGTNYLRIDQAGYQVTLRTPNGRELWSRTFAAAATADVRPDGVLLVTTADGGHFVLDPDTGADRLSCTQCTITTYPSGIAVQYNEFGQERVETHAVEGGVVRTPPTTVAEGLRIVPGPSVLPVLTGTGDGQVQATQGRYEIRDPARSEALWQITDPELSKANTKPCGTEVAFALKDRSRVFYTLVDGEPVGRMEPPSFDAPAENLDNLNCIGSAGTELVFANPDQVTAVDTESGEIAWTRPIIGSAEAVDGYVVLRQGTTLTVLRPN